MAARAGTPLTKGGSSRMQGCFQTAANCSLALRAQLKSLQSLHRNPIHLWVDQDLTE